MAARVFAAVDIGASGGRVMAGLVEGGSVSLRPVHRFANPLVETAGSLRWDFDHLHREMLRGLRQLARACPEVESIGIDTWAVDVGLLDAAGELLAPPVAYRDGHAAQVVDDVHATVPPEELFAVNGLQFLPFTTLYQLAAQQRGLLWDRAAHVVLVPDLLAYRLTGRLRTELTNASTTGLLDVRTRRWSDELLRRLDIPRGLLPDLETPGTVRGVTHALGPPVPVTTVGSHDTASAVVGIPATTDSFGYVSCGTWSLVGLELPAPVLTPDARAANFTNEIGVDGRVRFLRNVGGLWLLQECLREWNSPDLEDLLAAAAALPRGGPVIDVDDPALLAPGNMPARIAAAVSDGEGDGRVPRTPAALARCIVDSLALAYTRTLRRAADLTGRKVEVIHLVGGGSRNELLCRLTANEAGVPVVAGPVEATALGNILVQARAHGAAPATLEDLRGHLARASTLRRYEPT
ncbi:rhamnulokinase [Parafrankia sp. FMc2]|uniref:rhamnulokinase n=1 Tax=Parafrankia sp. FMc2 TaxID=3233196 RepID=UPI0034D60A6F